MKVRTTLLLFLALALLLSACGTQRTLRAAETAQPGPIGNTVPGVDPASGDWIGRGGSYRFVPGEQSPDTNDLLLRDGVLYTLLNRFDTDGQHYALLRDNESIWTPEGSASIVTLLGQSGEGFWLHLTLAGQDWLDRREILSLVSPAGETLRELDVTGALPEGERSFFSSFGLYRDLPWAVTSAAELLFFDGEGSVTRSVALPQPFLRPLSGGDGELYLSEDDGQTQTLSRLGEDGFAEVFSCPSGPIFPGDGDSPFLLSRSDGIYRVSVSGELSPIVVYEECCLSLTGLSLVLPYGDGRYLCETAAGVGTLEPAEPGELHPRIRLRFGYLGGNEWFMPNQETVAAFNLLNQEYYIEMVDLTEGGALSDEQALTRLNASLTDGSGPDLFSLSAFNSGEISPFPYARKGLLVDLGELLEQGGEISPDDIVIAKALQNELGGLYLLCDSMTVDSFIADFARFGDRWGWTFEEYLALDRDRPENQMIIYNLTRDYFLRRSAASFMRSAIDWGAGTCDFDNEGFLALLHAAKNLHETPEPADPEDIVYWAPEHIFDGTQITEAVMLMDVSGMASEQRLRGVEKLSFIGWPSFDGSCGSVFSLQSPFAVFRSSKQLEGCREFVSFALQHPNAHSLPVYRPLLEERLTAAQHDLSALPLGNYEFTEPLTAAEADQFREFLGHIEHSSLCDQTALGIILEECEPFFRGDRSAEQTAALIQSRLSLYVAEQS